MLKTEIDIQAQEPSIFNYKSIYDPRYVYDMISYLSSQKVWEYEIKEDNIEIEGYKVYYNGIVNFECTCEEYHTENVGTCQHIEAVKTFIDENSIEHREVYDSYKNVFVSPNKQITNYKKSIYRDLNLETKQVEPIDAIPYIMQNFVTDKEPKAHQRTAINMIINNKKVAIGLPMGWGKTLTAIWAWQYVKAHNQKIKAVVVCPNNLKQQWNAQLPNSVLVTKKTKAEQAKNADALIINYESFSKDFFQQLITDTEQEYFLIADEIQKTKNKETDIWEEISKWKNAYNVSYMIGLSGTLIENKAEDLLNILHILGIYFGKRWVFENFYTKAKNAGNPRNIQKIKQDISPYIFTLTEEELTAGFSANFNIITQEIYCKINDKFKEKHDRFYENYKTLQGMSKTKEIPQGQILGMSQMARLLSNGIDSQKSTIDISEKAKELKKIIDKYPPGQKIIIFSEFVTMIQEVIKYLNLEEQSLVYTGEVKKLSVKTKLIEEFNNNPSKLYFFASDSGGVGLDGLQNVSNVMVELEAVWNPAKSDQRRGRIIRMGQKEKDLHFYLIMSRNSIEEYDVYPSSLRKRELRKSLL